MEMTMPKFKWPKFKRKTKEERQTKRALDRIHKISKRMKNDEVFRTLLVAHIIGNTSPQALSGEMDTSMLEEIQEILDEAEDDLDELEAEIDEMIGAGATSFGLDGEEVEDIRLSE